MRVNELRSQSRGVGIAVAVPLVIAAAAYGLWWISDRLLYVGPLDRAAFGWVVVVPTWAMGPAAMAFAARRLPERVATAVVVSVAAVLAIATFGIVWSAVIADQGGCETSPRMAAVDWVLPAVFALAFSGTWGVAAAAGVHLARAGRIGTGLAASLGLMVIHLATTIVLAGYGLMFLGGCNRP